MQKKLIALAALSTLATGVMAQSSVTLYGRVDVGVGQVPGTSKNNEVREGGRNRLGFRGVEDLGGGLKAFFDIQHSFSPDTGAIRTPATFWEGQSIVGLESSFGRVYLGRTETAAYSIARLPFDPWGGETINSNFTIINGTVATNRLNNSVNYRFTGSGLTVGAQIAEAEGNITGDGADRPWSVGAGYTAGPFSIGVGYEDPSDSDDQWANIAASWNLGFMKLSGLFAKGNNVADDDIRSYLIAATAPIGGGELRASYGIRENKDAVGDGKIEKQFGLGYYYSLSKRTTAYVDVGNERGTVTDGVPELKKTGYMVGLRHNF